MQIILAILAGTYHLERYLSLGEEEKDRKREKSSPYMVSMQTLLLEIESSTLIAKEAKRFTALYPKNIQNKHLNISLSLSLFSPIGKLRGCHQSILEQNEHASTSSPLGREIMQPQTHGLILY